jgi:hypothetical protein
LFGAQLNLADCRCGADLKGGQGKAFRGHIKPLSFGKEAQRGFVPPDGR